jgi:hypothetical protein
VNQPASLRSDHHARSWRSRCSDLGVHVGRNPHGAPGPRTSQDLAYGQLGMAMYYYLTRDESVLADILRLKEHIFGGYWNAEWGMLRWVAKGDP